MMTNHPRPYALRGDVRLGRSASVDAKGDAERPEAGPHAERRDQVEPRRARLAGGLAVLLLLLATAARAADAPRVAFKIDDASGQMTVDVDGREALVYRYGPHVDLPHFWPVRSPSGKSLTVQQTDPFPHHRSFWFADTVQLAGHRKASFYNALYSQVDRKDPKSAFRDHVRQVEFTTPKTKGDEGTIGMKLVWEMDQNVPVLDESREMRVVALGEGQYLLDIRFTLTASHGDVNFVSDAVHYAWPYVRIDPAFSVQKGGTITNSEGGVNQKGTNLLPARWVDYTNTVEGATEGLALFSAPENDHPHRWLTRDYGTFGPRRADEKSGKPFVLKKGQSISTRVGVLVHSGDVKSGKVAERYKQFVEGKL